MVVKAYTTFQDTAIEGDYLVRHDDYVVLIESEENEDGEEVLKTEKTIYRDKIKYVSDEPQFSDVPTVKERVEEVL